MTRFTVFALVVLVPWCASSQVPVKGLEGVATVGDKIAVEDLISIYSEIASPIPVVTMPDSWVVVNSTRNISKIVSFSSQSAVAITYVSYRASALERLSGTPKETINSDFEGKTFNIDRDTLPKVNVLDPVAIDLSESVAWLQATKLLDTTVGDLLLNLDSESLTPALILGSMVTGKTMKLSKMADGAPGIKIYSVTLTIAEHCPAGDLILAGKLSVVPNTSMTLQLDGKDLRAPTEMCDVWPAKSGCPKRSPEQSPCRLAAPGVRTTIKVSRAIKKAL